VTSATEHVTIYPEHATTITEHVTTEPELLATTTEHVTTEFEHVTIREPELVRRAREVILKSEKAVVLCEEGVGGTYFVVDDSRLAVFKPTDEEPGAVNNPKKILAKPLLPPGGGAKREVAAYLIDNGRAGVPETYFLENVKNPAMSGDSVKSGSLQKFVENVGDASSVGSSLFSVSDVHNIGILDLRLFNMDRNSENILVQKTSDKIFRLIPIDHTYTLPPTLDSAWFDWQYWSQAKAPFSEECLNYIREIDAEKDADILRSVGIDEDSIRTMKISTIFLKIGAEFGLNLFQIASMVCRKKKSPIRIRRVSWTCGRKKSEFYGRICEFS